MKPIETLYKGYRFRSRLEARWAVFLDALGIQWEYEPQGYNLGDGVLYLPDFFIPKQPRVSRSPFWIEIKGEDPTVDENDKAVRLAQQTGLDVYLFAGSIQCCLIDHGRQGDHIICVPPVTSAERFYPEAGWDMDYCWCQCPHCGKLGIEYDGRTDRLDCKQCLECLAISRAKAPPQYPCRIHGPELNLSGCPRSPHGDKGYNSLSERLVSAYKAARRARFERGGVVV